ncbi:MAG: hypothetical protein Q8942_15920 [Bacillota bacterium]|nr:hypothetical protein [Bacillota bacterium]
MEETSKEILSQMHIMSNKLQEVNNKQDGANNRLMKLETTIENKTNVKIQALFEDRDIIHNKLDNISNELEVIKEQITDHDIKIQIIDNKSKAI